ncbi:hypothetical protein DFJ58DRAFT_662398 [Suillus subalutaceus]|uniref:uncharacterized protein n=1 Tax=Suillus subalutaceus TaxID=48586 RepID=UPI001B86579C|nr:uncharacterized protein DFJ58DRAFT_662398 [Suillus subalutaceus]KAG1849451.1 hypothetical protein DFJ58DRAFT_662398 [Suillus subalutaceus]
MVNTRTYILPTSSVSYPPLSRTLCRLYSTSWNRPRQAMMLTPCSGYLCSAQRFPVPESLFEEATVQPYVHNCFITMYEGRHTYRFCVFFKQHLHLRANSLLSSGNRQFRGNAVVTRIGVKNSSVVNMRGRDNALADFIIHQ